LAAPFSIQSEKQLLRPRCDAWVFKPLQIEIIARQKDAPAFEPQKLAWVDGPANRDRNPREQGTSEDRAKGGRETGPRQAVTGRCG
jgi:hypothetical protein